MPSPNPPATLGGASALSDRELMGRVREGEIGRLGELFERHQARLHNFFLKLARRSSTAEDLVQEVFVRMLKYRHTYRPGAEFAPWMFTLARNAATDLYRARPKELQEDPEAPEPAAEGPDPVETLEHAEQVRRLRTALARLAPEKRELLVFARFSELRYEEIAEILGISVGAVKVRVHRALKDLKQAYLAGAGEETA